MARYVIAAVLASLYVVGSILIVRGQGQAYRDGLARMKPATKEIERASPSPTAATKTVGAPVAAINLDASRPVLTISPPAQADRFPKKPIVDNPSTVPPATELARATPLNSPIETVASASTAGKSVAPDPLANDPFWNRPNLTRDWDIAYLSAKKESELGAEFHKLVVHFNPLVEEPGPWLSRVEDAAKQLLKKVQRKDIHYTFYILDSNVVNAFSTPGGYIYLSRALVDLIGEDEDYALQFAIGHEIAHVDKKHALKCLQDPGVVARVRMGTLQKLFLLILPYGYLRSGDDTVNQEFEADEWASNQMQQLLRSRHDILVFLNKFDGYARSQGFGEGRAKPKRGSDLSPLENHYRAQTAARTRLKHLKAFMDQAAKGPK